MVCLLRLGLSAATIKHINTRQSRNENGLNTSSTGGWTKAVEDIQIRQKRLALAEATTVNNPVTNLTVAGWKNESESAVSEDSAMVHPTASALSITEIYKLNMTTNTTGTNETAMVDDYPAYSSNFDDSLSAEAVALIMRGYYVIWGLEIFGGTITNLLSFIVLVQAAMRELSITPYLIALTITDTFFLWADSSFWFWYYVTGSPMPGPTGDCSIRSWMIYFSSLSSSYLMVLVTMERMVAVWLPMMVKAWSSRKRVILSAVFVPIMFMLIYLPVIFSADHVCTPLLGWEFYSYWVLPVMDLILDILIVDPILMFGNISLIVAIRRSENRVRGNDSDKQASQSSVKVAKLAISLAFVHLGLTAPYKICRVYNQLSGVSNPDKVAGNLIYNAVYYYLYLIMMLNYVVNFFIYLSTSDGFRKEFKVMFLCKK